MIESDSIRKRCGTLSLIVLLVFSTSSSALTGDEPDEDSFSLVDAVMMALETYPAVRIAQAALDQAGAASSEAVSEWFPSLSFAASATQNKEPMAAYPIHGIAFGGTNPFDLGFQGIPPFNRSLGQYGVSLGYTLFDGGGRLANVRRTVAQRNAARASCRKTDQDVIARVVSAYLTVLSRHEIMVAHEHRLEALESELSRIEKHFEQESAARIEVLRAEAELESARADLVGARADLDVAERELAILVGVPDEKIGAGKLVRVEITPVPLPDREDLVTRATGSNPLVEQARCNMAGARAGVSYAHSARWPKLQLLGNYFNMGNFEGTRVNEWKAEAALSLPIFTGGRISRHITMARAAQRAAEEQLRLTELEVRQYVDRALAAHEEARARVVSLTRAVEAFSEVVKIEKLMLEAGSGTQTDYLDAEASLVTAKAHLVEARHGEIFTRVELARLTGELNIDWIVRYLENCS